MIKTASRKRPQGSIADAGFGLLLCLPAIVLLGLFVVWPFAYGFWISLHAWDGFSKMTWNGGANYLRLFRDRIFLIAIENNVIFLVLTLVLKNVLGIALALLLNGVARGRAFVRAVTFIPVTMSFVAVGLLWSWVYNPVFGLLNEGLDVFGLGALKRSWLGDANIAIYSIVAVEVWKWVGFHAVLYLAGLQTIPADYLEAAKLDGANAWHRLVRITLPLLSPIIFINVILGVSGAFVRNFDIVYVLTKGGPNHSTEVVLTAMIAEAFQNTSMGYAAAMGYALFLIVGLVSIGLIALMRARRVAL